LNNLALVHQLDSFVFLLVSNSKLTLTIMKYEGSYDSFPFKPRVVINIVTLYTGGKE